MARIIFAESAVRDLEDVRGWYNSQGGARLVGEVIVSIEQVAEFPESGRIVPEFDTPRLREIVHAPFRIVYRLDGEMVSVVRVWRSERLMQEP